LTKCVSQRSLKRHGVLDFLWTRLHHRADDLQVAVQQPVQRDLCVIDAAHDANLYQAAAKGQ